MVKRVVAERGISIHPACTIFNLSQTCYRYEAKKCAEDEQVADWLLRLTDNHRTWGFGLCYLYLRNVKGATTKMRWTHKLAYQIYKELGSVCGSSRASGSPRRRPSPWLCPRR